MHVLLPRYYEWFLFVWFRIVNPTEEETEITFQGGLQACILATPSSHCAQQPGWQDWIWLSKHRKNCECCPVSQLIVRSRRLSWIQNCSQCLKCHCLRLCIWLCHVMSSHQSEQMSQRSQMSTCQQGWIPPRLQWAPSKDLSISSSLIFNLKCLHTTEISSPSAAGVKYNICTFVSFSIRFPGRGLWRRFSCCVSHVYIIVLKTTNTNAKSFQLSRRAIN